ncbi:MAG TPA: sigma 54-interacting transcriptional regulator, partial [Candidatus Sulfotelmatobacter sp.]|nr:sigma 54-interacting transcriptional regulator [Candidatus Sulfotelmatobacter sp.]
MPRRVLIVRQSERLPNAEAFLTQSPEGIFTLQSCSPESLPATDELNRFDAIVGLALCDTSQSVSFLQQLRASVSEKVAMVAVLPRSAGGEILEAAASLADDFLLWPFPENELAQRMRWLLARREPAAAAVSDRLIDEFALGHMVGNHPVFRAVLERMPIIARSGEPVLIVGETGTGKELSARAIHNLSRRRDFPFIAVDCAALP